MLQAEVAQERTMNTKNREVMQDMQREVQHCHNSLHYVTAAGWFSSIPASRNAIVLAIIDPKVREAKSAAEKSNTKQVEATSKLHQYQNQFQSKVSSYFFLPGQSIDDPGPPASTKPAVDIEHRYLR